MQIKKVDFLVSKVVSRSLRLLSADQLVGIIPSSSKNLPEPEGIDRFEIVGRKEFLHDDTQLDAYLSHILKWWRGKRNPEGVPLEYASRCS